MIFKWRSLGYAGDGNIAGASHGNSDFKFLLQSPSVVSLLTILADTTTDMRLDDCNFPRIAPILLAL